MRKKQIETIVMWTKNEVNIEATSGHFVYDFASFDRLDWRAGKLPIAHGDTTLVLVNVGNDNGPYPSTLFDWLKFGNRIFDTTADGLTDESITATHPNWNTVVLMSTLPFDNWFRGWTDPGYDKSTKTQLSLILGYTECELSETTFMGVSDVWVEIPTTVTVPTWW